MQLISISVGKPKNVIHEGKEVSTGIFKKIINGPVKVKKLNLEGDGQADLKVHGGENKAVYAYPVEHYEYWKTAHPHLNFEGNAFGENLLISGLFEKEVCIGDRFQIGSAQVVVTTPRMPCFKLGIKMKDPSFVNAFMEAQLTGFYFKVLQEGEMVAGNEIIPLGNDDYGLTVHEVSSLYTTQKKNRELLKKAAESPSLPEDWTSFFQKKLDRLS